MWKGTGHRIQGFLVGVGRRDERRKGRFHSLGPVLDLGFRVLGVLLGIQGEWLRLGGTWSVGVGIGSLGLGDVF